ncbi:MAG: hypothetical protein HY063_09230 [Bacteroidetes bacterium]|nr:hypothetical protein [Bacteroidota bacterium]
MRKTITNNKMMETSKEVPPMKIGICNSPALRFGKILNSPGGEAVCAEDKVERRYMSDG